MSGIAMMPFMVPATLNAAVSQKAIEKAQKEKDKFDAQLKNAENTGGVIFPPVSAKYSKAVERLAKQDNPKEYKRLKQEAKNATLPLLLTGSETLSKEQQALVKLHELERIAEKKYLK